MRLLTRKIYRAFPQLDQFDDEACIRSIRRAWSTDGFSRFCLVLYVVVPVAVVLWAIVIMVASVVFDLSVFPYVSDSLYLMSTGFIWFPLIAGFRARDFWLARQVRKQIDGACCEDCGYCLVGLGINTSNQDSSVQCPECGKQHILDDYRLSREDIDPTLANS